MGDTTVMASRPLFLINIMLVYDNYVLKIFTFQNLHKTV